MTTPDNDDDDNWISARRELAGETPTRKSQPADIVRFEPSPDDVIHPSPPASATATTNTTTVLDSSSSSSAHVIESLSTTKRSLTFSSSKLSLATNRPAHEDDIPLVIDDDDAHNSRSRKIVNSASNGAANNESVDALFGQFAHSSSSTGYAVSRLTAKSAASNNTNGSAATTGHSSAIPHVILSDSEDAPRSRTAKSAPTVKKSRVLTSDDETDVGHQAKRARGAFVESDDEGTSTTKHAATTAAADDDDDDERTEEDDALDSKERELIEVESLVKQCESYTLALALDGGDVAAPIQTIAQPRSFRVQLRNYQLVGVNWLALLHSKQLNGILADEMGLGKTAQTIAFLAHLKETGDEGPHLITVPSSTLHNWARELGRFVPSLSVAIYHGSAKERLAVYQRIFVQQRDNNVLPNVVLTTYNVLTGKADKKFFKAFTWSYLVLDEAHAIKNPKSQRYTQLSKIAGHAERRLLLTGTPLQNNLTELFALLNFLMPDVLQYEQLTRVLDAPRLRLRGGAPDDVDIADGENIEQAYIRRAKKILSPFILRRLKAHVTSELPAKVEQLEVCEAPESQRSAYQRLLATSKRSLAAGTIVDLTAAVADVDDGADAGDEERVLVIDGDADADDDNDNGGRGRKKKPTGKAAAAAAAAAASALRSPIRRRASSIGGSGGGGAGAGVQKSTVSNILMQMRKMANHPLLCREFYDDARVVRVARALADTGVNDFQYPMQELIEDLKINSDFEIWQQCESYATAALLAERPPRSMLVDNAGKMRKLLSLLATLTASGVKTLVFSQMTRLLDILEVVLQDARIRYVRLDGSTAIAERQPLIDRFNNEPDLQVFLLSTRAGGLGINLTSATHVIFYDSGFNPQVERQAEDRCHRLGQEKVVTVHRLVLHKSIDEDILEVASEKTRLNDMMLEEGKFFAAAAEQELSHQRMASVLQRQLQQADD